MKSVSPCNLHCKLTSTWNSPLMFDRPSRKLNERKHKEAISKDTQWSGLTRNPSSSRHIPTCLFRRRFEWLPQTSNWMFLVSFSEGADECGCQRDQGFSAGYYHTIIGTVYEPKKSSNSRCEQGDKALKLSIKLQKVKMRWNSMWTCSFMFPSLYLDMG